MPDHPPDYVGAQFGSYRLTRLLGTGGFGEVYEAEHLYLARKRAIKVLLGHLARNPRFRERFLREAQLLDSLHHPHIMPLQGLEVAGDLIYLVMPLLTGGTLEQALKNVGRLLTLEEVVRYLDQMAAALDYAHSQGVVHLDLKPANFLLNAEGLLVLADFGFAHIARQESLEGGSSLSFGTPAYMAPEHILGKPERLSDLYSLGVILFQMLAGHLPFAGENHWAIANQHLNARPPALRSLRLDIPPALEQVLARALSKSPSDRYQTAEALREAFWAALRAPRAPSRPVTASGPAVHRGMASPSAPVVPPVVTFPARTGPAPPVGALLFTLHGHAREVGRVAWSPDSRLLASCGGVPFGDHTDKTVRLWDAERGQPLALLTSHTDQVYAVAWSPKSRLLASASGDKTVRLWDGISGQALSTLTGHTDGVGTVAWSPNGRLLASASADLTIRLWDAESLQFLGTLKGHTLWIEELAWSPDGQRLVSASSDKTARIWDSMAERPLALLAGHTGAVLTAAWCPDGQRIASAGADKTVRVWDARRGQPLFTLAGHTDMVQKVIWSPDASLLASAGSDQTVRLWDAEHGQMLCTLVGHTTVVRALAWSPDGRRLASASDDQTIRLWDALRFQPLALLTGHTGAVQEVAWSPDGRRLASASKDGTVRVWSVEEGQAAPRQT